MNTIANLAELFRKFPGIGPRQAKRFVYFLLTQSDSYRRELAEHIVNLKKEVTICPRCFRYFTKVGATTHCSVCTNAGRDQTLLMLVEKDVDLESVEKSKLYSGLYFVLGGVVPILEKEPEKRIRIQELEKRIAKEDGSIKEIIFALSVNPDGDNTHDYLVERLTPLSKEYGFKLSSLGRGLSTGSELEYSDSETIKNALRNRQ